MVLRAPLLEAQNERWKRHFSKILNVQSEFDLLEELGKVKQRPDLAEFRNL